jgi:hypothetical protein
MIEDKTFRTFIRIFKSKSLSANIKLSLHEALIISLMTYACLAWELAADAYLLKLKRLQNKILRSSENFLRCTSVRNLHPAFNLPYVYNYTTKLFRRQAEDVQNHENVYVRSIEQGETRHREYKRHKLGCGQAYDRSSDQAAVVE